MTNMSKKHQKQQEQRQRRKLSDHDRNFKESIEYLYGTVLQSRRNPVKNLFHMSDVMSSISQSQINQSNRMNLELVTICTTDSL